MKYSPHFRWEHLLDISYQNTSIGYLIFGVPKIYKNICISKASCKAISGAVQTDMARCECRGWAAAEQRPSSGRAAAESMPNGSVYQQKEITTTATTQRECLCHLGQTYVSSQIERATATTLNFAYQWLQQIATTTTTTATTTATTMQACRQANGQQTKINKN